MPASTRYSIYVAPAVQLQILDAPPLRSGDELSPGLYIAARTGGKLEGSGVDGVGYGASQQAPAIEIYLSRDGGTTYKYAMEVSQHASVGILLGTENDLIGDGTGAGNIFKVDAGATLSEAWDRTSKLPILWFDGFTPESTTDAEVENGANVLLVGAEVVQFATVETNPIASGFGSTDESDKGAFWHADLLRGRRGTENEIAAHTLGETVVYVDDAVTFLPLKPSDIGSTLYFKAVAQGGELADAAAQSLVYTGRNMMPFAPARVRGVRDGSNDLTISWDRRTRSEVRQFGVGARPFTGDASRYVVEILSTPMPYTVLRTITVEDGTTEAVYTAAQHATDSLTAGGAVNVRVYQVSDFAGRGHGGTWTIPANAGGAGTPTPSATLYADRLD